MTYHVPKTKKHIKNKLPIKEHQSDGFLDGVAPLDSINSPLQKHNSQLNQEEKEAVANLLEINFPTHDDPWQKCLFGPTNENPEIQSVFLNKFIGKIERNLVSKPQNKICYIKENYTPDIGSNIIKDGFNDWENNFNIGTENLLKSKEKGSKKNKEKGSKTELSKYNLKYEKKNNSFDDSQSNLDQSEEKMFEGNQLIVKGEESCLSLDNKDITKRMRYDQKLSEKKLIYKRLKKVPSIQNLDKIMQLTNHSEANRNRIIQNMNEYSSDKNKFKKNYRTYSVKNNDPNTNNPKIEDHIYIADLERSYHNSNIDAITIENRLENSEKKIKTEMKANINDLKIEINPQDKNQNLTSSPVKKMIAPNFKLGHNYKLKIGLNSQRQIPSQTVSENINYEPRNSQQINQNENKTLVCELNTYAKALCNVQYQNKTNNSKIRSVKIKKDSIDKNIEVNELTEASKHFASGSRNILTKEDTFQELYKYDNMSSTATSTQQMAGIRQALNKKLSQNSWRTQVEGKDQEELQKYDDCNFETSLSKKNFVPDNLNRNYSATDKQQLMASLYDDLTQIQVKQQRKKNMENTHLHKNSIDNVNFSDTFMKNYNYLQNTQQINEQKKLKEKGSKNKAVNPTLVVPNFLKKNSSMNRRIMTKELNTNYDKMSIDIIKRKNFNVSLTNLDVQNTKSNFNSSKSNFFENKYFIKNDTVKSQSHFKEHKSNSQSQNINLTTKNTKTSDDDTISNSYQQSMMVNKLAKQYAENNARYLNNYYGKGLEKQLHVLADSQRVNHYESCIPIKKPPSCEKTPSVKQFKRDTNLESNIPQVNNDNNQENHFVKKGMLTKSNFHRTVKSLVYKSPILNNKPNPIIGNKRHITKNSIQLQYFDTLA